MIPHCFHQLWVGSPLPEIFAAFAEGWRRLHPQWDHILWTERNLPKLRNQELYDRAGELCPGFEEQLRSDVARLEILYEHGGVYIDTDFEVVRPIGGLLEGIRAFAAWEIQDEVLNNAIIGCEPHNPFVQRLIEHLPASVLSGRSVRPSKISGPHYLTAQYRGHEAELTVFPECWFYPYRCNELGRANERFPDAYAIHHWANQRRLRRAPL